MGLISLHWLWPAFLEKSFIGARISVGSKLYFWHRLMHFIIEFPFVSIVADSMIAMRNRKIISPAMTAACGLAAE